MNTNWPTAETIDELIQKKLKDTAEETDREFRAAVRIKLMNAINWPVIVEESAYLVLNNPVLKQVEKELNESGYATRISSQGELVIERKKS